MVEIDKKSYVLDDNNFYSKECRKKQILLGHSFSKNMDHFIGWKNRINGKFKRTSSYTITLSGKVYEHYNPIYYSEFMGFDKIDKNIISVILENEGWLHKDLINGAYYDWLGNIYNRKSEVVEKRWRNKTYWAPYSTKQLNSTLHLMRYLSNKFEIPLDIVEHNTKVDNILNFNGIAFKSNYDRDFTDLSPAFDVEYFKNKLNT